MSSVLVGFGTQDHSTAALRWGAQAAMLLKEPLEVVSVFDPTYAELDSVPIDDLMVKERETVAEKVRAAGVDDREIHMLQGDPIRAFADYVEGYDEALVVVGASAHAGWGEFASGACAHALLHHLPRERPGPEALDLDVTADFGKDIVVGRLHFHERHLDGNLPFQSSKFFDV